MRAFTLTFIVAASLHNAMSVVIEDMRLALRFRGLSSSGLRMLSHIGFGRSESTFFRRLRKIEKDARTALVDYHPSMFWIDNFNLKCAHQTPKGAEAYRMGNWTVMAGMRHHEIRMPELLFEGAIADNGSVLFDFRKGHMNKDEEMLQIIDSIDENTSHITTSDVTTMKVRNVPLKPLARNLNIITDRKLRLSMQEALTAKVSGARRMKPFSLSENNPGSNTGLTNIMRDLAKRNVDGRVQIVVCDVNTHWRTMKVSCYFFVTTKTHTF